MSRLPSSKTIVNILIKNGFMFVSQRGSHQKYNNGKQIVIVPAPRKEVPIGTLRSICRQSGIDIAEFLNK